MNTSCEEITERIKLAQVVQSKCQSSTNSKNIIEDTAFKKADEYLLQIKNRRNKTFSSLRKYTKCQSSTNKNNLKADTAFKKSWGLPTAKRLQRK